MSKKIPINKLANEQSSYYPLSVLESVVTTHDLVAGRDVGDYKKGDVIPAVTPLDEIITSLVEGRHGAEIDESDIIKIINDYTAFEVKASGDTMRCGFYLRNDVDQDDNNVFIEWGDGEVTFVKDISEEDYYESYKDRIDEPENFEHGEHNSLLIHDYAEEGIYIVKIYGNTYWGLMTCKTQEGESVPCIISRVFDVDLPLARNVHDLASWCTGSKELTEIRLPNYFNIRNVINWSGAFQNCVNLTKVEGFKNKWFVYKVYADSSMFAGCTSLKECSINVAGSTTANASTNTFNNCVALESNIKDLIPGSGFDNRTVTMTGDFTNCKKLTGDVTSVAHLLWEDTTKVWITGSYTKIVHDLPYDLDTNTVEKVQVLPTITEDKDIGKLFYLTKAQTGYTVNTLYVVAKEGIAYKFNKVDLTSTFLLTTENDYYMPGLYKATYNATSNVATYVEQQGNVFKGCEELDSVTGERISGLNLDLVPISWGGRKSSKKNYNGFKNLFKGQTISLANDDDILAAFASMLEMFGAKVVLEA